MEETTFPAHVNSPAERVVHRSNRRLELIDYIQKNVSIQSALDFTMHAKRNRRDLSKPRKIK